MQIDSIIHPLNLGKSNFQFLHPASDLNHVSAAIFHINCLKKSIDVGVPLDLHTVGPEAWGMFMPGLLFLLAETGLNWQKLAEIKKPQFDCLK